MVGRGHRARAVVVAILISMALGGVEESYAEKAQRNLLTNGDFQQWRGNHPQGWQLGIGASRGPNDDAPHLMSEVQKIRGPALSLRGGSNTKTWRSVAQDIVLVPSKSYQLSFEAMADKVHREGRQYDNCYVGVIHFSQGGKKLGLAMKDLSKVADWSRQELRFVPPELTAKTTVLIFLSKSGSLKVKEMVLREVAPMKPFDELIAAFRTHYSFTEMKKIRWGDLDQQFGASAREATSVEAFANAIEPMLLSLKDMHVWIEMPDGKRRAVYRSLYKPNVDHATLRSRLHSIQDYPGIGFVGLVKTGRKAKIGMVVVTGLPRKGDYESFMTSIMSMNNQAGIIVDLRRNSGGSEARAAQIAGLFVRQRMPYAGSLRRVEGRLVEMSPRIIEPSIGALSGIPVVCLVGPGCVSSGEGFALMMKSIDGVKLVGLPTRGASGNPAPVTLSNGVRVWFSRWVSLESDGTPIEGRGVIPDERVQHVAGADVTLDRALHLIQQALK